MHRNQTRRAPHQLACLSAGILAINQCKWPTLRPTFSLVFGVCAPNLEATSREEPERKQELGGNWHQGSSFIALSLSLGAVMALESDLVAIASDSDDLAWLPTASNGFTWQLSSASDGGIVHFLWTGSSFQHLFRHVSLHDRQVPPVVPRRSGEPARKRTRTRKS